MMSRHSFGPALGLKAHRPGPRATFRKPLASNITILTPQFLTFTYRRADPTLEVVQRPPFNHPGVP